MDLRLFGRVFWRFKYLVAGGFVLAVVLGIFTVAKPDFSHGAPRLVPRTKALYGSTATLLVTQSGFPWGSAVQAYTTDGGQNSNVPAGDLGRLTALANLYVQITNSDIIKNAVARRGPAPSDISATQNYSISPSYYSTALPTLTLAGTSDTPAKALAVTQSGVDSLVNYIQQNQRAAKISDNQRVVIQELQRPDKTTVVNGTKKTLPIVVFITIMLAVTGLAFVLENLMPRLPQRPESLDASADAEPLVDGVRRSA
jgi:hypothetical protein